MKINLDLSTKLQCCLYCLKAVACKIENEQSNDIFESSFMSFFLYFKGLDSSESS